MVLRDFQEKKEIEKFIFSWPALIVAFLLVILVSLGVLRILKRELALRREIRTLEAKIKETEKKGEGFEKTLSELATPSGLEKEARRRFNLVRPGEEVAVFLEDNPPLASHYYQAKLAFLWAYVKNILFWR